MNQKMSRTVKDKAERAARRWARGEGRKLIKHRDLLILLASFEGLVILVLSLILTL